MSTERVFNFSAGPAVLPEIVLDEAARHLRSLPDVGMSVLEMSHRSKEVSEIFDSAVANIRTLANVPDDYHVLFLQGGATQQFAMVPLNLLSENGSADYVITGSWSKKAFKEAQRFGSVRIVGSSEDEDFVRIPTEDELKFSSDAEYLHITSNNTIFGTQWRSTSPGSTISPVVVDASSDIFSRPIDVGRHGLIYAGAQKNLGPAGVTLVIVKDEVVRRQKLPERVPTMLRYATFADSVSLYNTPPVFAIYIVGLVVKWLLQKGGLTVVAESNERKAGKLYSILDSSNFYQGIADAHSRSLMNVTFRLPNEELEKRFLTEATNAGLVGLKGHRSVGGLRASIYNAFPEDGVDTLTSFMREFERKSG